MILTMLVLVMSACGGDSGDDGDGEQPEATTAAPTQETSAPEPDATTTTSTAAPADQPGPAAAGGTGTATIGDTTWEFALSGDSREMCNPNLGGNFFVNMFGEDENGNEAVLSVQAFGSSAVVQAGDPLITGELWIADLNVYAENGDQDLPDGIGATAEVDGNSVSGTGVFYEDRSLTEASRAGTAYESGVRNGTFSVTCPAG